MDKVFQTILKRTRIRAAMTGTIFRELLFVCRLQLTIGMSGHMNTKLILAALALSLSLAGCAKKEEPAEAPAEAAPAEAAPEAAPAEAAPAEAPPAEAPPADAPPAEAPKP